MNEELSKIVVWLEVNRLSLNVTKTNFMLFGTAKNKIHSTTTFDNTLIINNNVISRVHRTTFLGVILDSSLLWKDHINYIKSKIAKSIGILHETKQLLNKNTLLTLYNTLVLPYLSYCIEVWGNSFDIYMNPLYRLQKKAITFITHSVYNASTFNLFKQLSILNLQKLYVYKIYIFMYWFNTHNLPLSLMHMFKKMKKYITIQLEIVINCMYQLLNSVKLVEL